MAHEELLARYLGQQLTQRETPPVVLDGEALDLGRDVGVAVGEELELHGDGDDVDDADQLFDPFAVSALGRSVKRIHEWAALSPEQRRMARQNYRLAQQLPADKRAEQWQQYEALTPEQKKVLRSAGSTSNTAARHAGANTALAKEAAKPIAPVP